MTSTKDIGDKGEERAVTYLISNQFQIIEKNYRYKRAEVDIIAQKDNCLHFIEVKTRKNDAFGFPEEFVSDRKVELFLRLRISILKKMIGNLMYSLILLQ